MITLTKEGDYRLIETKQSTKILLLDDTKKRTRIISTDQIITGTSLFRPQLRAFHFLTSPHDPIRRKHGVGSSI